jgi:hypothetical protein
MAVVSRCVPQRLRPFQFERDTFAFAHELVWEYRFDPATGKTTTVRAQPPPTYYHRCFVMVRAARQFFYHARFEPASPPPASAEACARLVRAVVSRNPRRLSAEPDRVVIPGYDGLRALSRAWEPVLKAECGGAWESYFLRSHWRMVFPVSRRHQEKTARRLAQALQQGGIPVVHLFRFPHVTINHGILLFAVAEANGLLRFQAYDPNIPAQPVELTYHLANHAFHFPPNHYWAGSKLQVVHIYRNWLY